MLLCDDDPEHAGNVLDHIHALERHSRHHVVSVNPRVGDRGARIDLDHFDVVVIHYTLVVTLDSYLPFELAERITQFPGLKVQFIQDEYRWVDEITARMRELGIDVLFTCVPEDVVPAIYGQRLPGVQTVTTLAGYVPDQLVGRRVPPLEARAIDVGYRGRAVPYWLGGSGRTKSRSLAVSSPVRQVPACDATLRGRRATGSTATVGRGSCRRVAPRSAPKAALP